MSVTSSVYLLAGGPGTLPSGHRPDPLLQRILAQCGKVQPRIAYLGSASGDHPGFFKRISGWLKDSGAGEVLLAPTASAKVNRGNTVEILDRADVIFVSGGDVEQGMRVLGDRSLASLLRARHEDGTMFIGLSAGSIMLARQWVRWRNPEDDSTAEAFACLGLVPILCDTHGEAESWEELVALLRITPAGAIGYGIPSGGVLVVARTGRLVAMGEPVWRFTAQGGAVARISDLEPDCTT